MKKLFVKAVSSFLVLTLLICGISMPAFAAEQQPSESDVLEFVAAGEDADNDSSDAEKILPTRAYKGIYSYTETLIYTGKGADRWLHITPWNTPNTLRIRMVDYQGNTVWQETFVANDTTHWFVGANVKYVYLKGTPGGVVEVSDTEH